MASLEVCLYVVAIVASASQFYVVTGLGGGPVHAVC